MLYLICAIGAAAVIAVDQLTKYLVRAGFGIGGYQDCIPGIFHLTYVQNTGAAFSSLLGKRWLLIVITAVFLAAVIWALARKWVSHPFGVACLSAVAAGGVGNLIDRIAFGWVTDMIAVDFISFPVFNVADIFVVCGCIGLLVYALFFSRNDGTKADEKTDGQEKRK